MLVDTLLDALCHFLEILSCLHIAEDTSHLCSRCKGNVEYHIGTQTLGIIDIGRLHPGRIALLSPVDERRLTSYEIGFRLKYSPHIHFEGFLSDRIHCLEPLHVTCNLVYLPSGTYPDFAVSTAWPCSACTCILNDLTL